MRSLLHYTLLSMVMVASMIQPIDITTHCACKKLNTALQQAVPLDHFKSILQQISYHESITQQDYTDIIIQAQHSAQESKKVVEKTLTDTQNKPNQSDTLQAAAALLAREPANRASASLALQPGRCADRGAARLCRSGGAICLSSGRYSAR